MELRQLKQDEVIFRQGDASACMFRVSRGKVGIFLDYGGPRQSRLTELGPGRYFGEMGLLDQAPRSATAVALSGDRRETIDRYYSDPYKLKDARAFTFISKAPKFAKTAEHSIR